MKRNQLDDLIAEIRRDEDTIRSIKGHVYTQGSEDCLRNFKEAADDAGITPAQAWITYARKHWDAVVAHMRGEANMDTEKIESRIADLQNYLYLGLGILRETEKGE